jgi:hypothetical protein
MKNIISETEVIAYDYLKDFGFNEDQINSLINQGKKDLHKELTKLELMLMHADVVALDDINNILHALKGLLFQLGNHDVAEKLNEIRSHDEREVILKEISKLLFSEKEIKYIV